MDPVVRGRGGWGSGWLYRGCHGRRLVRKSDDIRVLLVARAAGIPARSLLGASQNRIGERRCASNQRPTLCDGGLGWHRGLAGGVDPIFGRRRDKFARAATDSWTYERFSGESVFAHKVEPVGEFALVEGRSVIATGGILTHYNRPYADIHMEVREDRRRCGYGSFIVQELKRIAFERGNEPCARCDVGNIPSFRTLTRAGMRECGRILEGKIIR